ncbi:hypothetical protein [Paenibacillus endoradicis]|uniref:hypothetical protein n=1 Tax=Paenibacillus endoradicis TaxID=2972487 RepID=UPI002158B524|nr:hypothetical protein [Paenibacillus endoradicis]MCR8656630.1 hypothetical protein [Paenibacillus endoradicis]
MFIGHYSVSFISKKYEPQIPLWVLFLAVQFVDIIWSLFIFTGIEKATISHEASGSPLNLIYMPYTHSLLGAIFWSGIAFLIIKYIPILKNRSFKKAIIVSLAVFSHWLLDVIVHSADLPLWLNNYKIGLGLYDHAFISFSLEVILLLIGFLFYVAVTSGKKKVGVYGLYIFMIVIILFGINSVWGIKPPSSQIAAGFLLFCYIFFAIITAWIEKNRTSTI